MMMKENFTPQALKLWERVPAWAQEKLLANVYCTKCVAMTTIINFSGHVVDGDLILSGVCKACASEVTRLIESE